MFWDDLARVAGEHAFGEARSDDDEHHAGRNASP